ncbi:MAG: 2Fe-2S iron-sulfur cluster binding domain-containing protein [Alphaproteobacteria bacterium]|nr:2Fe-2S iron-sulfur cluster binding domain-containing protein [Alphaproteobacteria bacterium]
MPHVTFIAHDNSARTVDVPDGLSLMDAALKFRIPGIDGDCGGACACATCHIYVDPEWVGRLAPVQSLEAEMLKFAQEPNEQSRLACQIKAGPELEGLVVRTPKSQY